ncbi:hypothetical protein D9M72_439180 [compost metagenome]
MAAVTMPTSGCAARSARSPGREAIRHTYFMVVTPASFRRFSAAMAELPVASIGSTTITMRSWMSSGILK